MMKSCSNCGGRMLILIAQWRQPVVMNRAGTELQPMDVGHIGEVIGAICAGCTDPVPVTVTAEEQEWWVGHG